MTIERAKIYSPENAVIYIRLSTKKEVEDVRLGAEAQRKSCKDYCIRNNIKIVETYEEIVSACTGYHKRPVFPGVIASCVRNNAILVVSQQDRLTRNLDDWSGFISGRIFGKRTPKLVCAETPNTSELEGDIRAIFAQHERKRIAQRTKDALAILKSKGVSIGAAGRKAASTIAISLTLDAVTLAEEMRDGSVSYTAIAEELNRRGFTTSRGTPWSREAIAYRLKQNRKETLVVEGDE